MRLRAAVIGRDSALAWAREDHAQLAASIPGLPKRIALVRHVEKLTFMSTYLAASDAETSARCFSHVKT